MRRVGHLWLAVCVVVLAACADPLPEGGTAPPPSSASPGSARVGIYEALIRHLVNPDGTQPIYVVSDLCYQLMKDEVTCPDHLSRGERQELLTRIQDLGDVVFLPNDEVLPNPDEPFQQIVLGPIVDKPDGLRVEGGSVCGNVCGSGAVYVVVATESGYRVTGMDETYGAWVA